MCDGSNAAFKRSWILAMAGASGWNTPTPLSPPRNSVAWPPTAVTALRMLRAVAASLSALSQRCAPPHSISCSPLRMMALVVDGILYYSGSYNQIFALDGATGDLIWAYLGPPEIAGVGLAVSDINAAGGVDGTKACHDIQDSGDSTDMSVSTASAGTLIAGKPSMVVGAASSSVSLNVVDTFASNKVVEVSPANTAVDLSGYSPYYFRTAPPDTIQGNALGTLKPTPDELYARGKALFMKNMCYTCHGTGGQGSRFGPRLAPRPMPWEAFAQQIRRPRASMPRYPAEYVSDAELADMFAYLASLEPGPKANEIPLLKE